MSGKCLLTVRGEKHRGKVESGLLGSEAGPEKGASPLPRDWQNLQTATNSTPRVALPLAFTRKRAVMLGAQLRREAWSPAEWRGEAWEFSGVLLNVL